MSKESFYNNIENNNRSNQNDLNKEKKKQESKNWWNTIKKQIKTSAILGLGTLGSLNTNAQEVNKKADKEFSQNGKYKVEVLNSFQAVKDKLKKAGDHGDLDTKTNNKVANYQEKHNFKERNVYNSIAEFNETIKNGGGEEGYYPHQVGENSPFWNKTGNIKINNLKDYKKHIEEDLIPHGFKGDLTPEIKYFGFKLEKDEFITTLKQDVLVDADVAGGRGWVRLNTGTRVVFERQILKDGRPCNVLKYIADCKNAIYGDNPYTRYLINKNGVGKFYINPESINSR